MTESTDRKDLPLPDQPLQTERLSLQLVSERSLPGLFEIHASDDVCRYLPFATWQDMKDACTWHERARQRHADGDAIQWAVMLRRSDTVLGMCLLFNYEPTHGRAELGYSLGQSYWGQGFAREAVSGDTHVRIPGTRPDGRARPCRGR